jgi:hypothetical protein
VRVLGDGLAEPLVQPVAAVPEPVARTVVRAATERGREEAGGEGGLELAGVDDELDSCLALVPIGYCF